MSDNSESNAVLGFVVGAIVIAALAFIFFVTPAGNGGNTPGDVDVTIEAPQVPAPANPG
jgi:hypothetical protein